MEAAPDPADTLFVVPPEEFVEARNALVKELRKDGERDRAAAIAALRRPSVADWALNLVASEQPDHVASFLEAASRSRAAQRDAASGREGADLRGALTDLRGQTESLVRLAVAAVKDAGKATGNLPPLLSARLQEVAASAGLADQLQDGRLGSADAEPDDVFDAGEPATPKRPSPRQATAEAARPLAAPKPSPADRQRRRQLEREVAAAARAYDKAEQARDRAAARLQSAEQAAVSAEEALARAHAERAAARDEDQQAAAALAVAEEALQRARTAVDDDSSH